MARELNINAKTIRDVLIRLERKGEIKLVEVDRFQRKIHTANIEKVDSGGSPEA